MPPKLPKPHICDGENCPGCPQCYQRTGRTICGLTCEHAERCGDCDGLLNADYECPTCEEKDAQTP